MASCFRMARATLANIPHWHLALDAFTVTAAGQGVTFPALVSGHRAPESSRGTPRSRAEARAGTKCPLIAISVQSRVCLLVQVASEAVGEWLLGFAALNVFVVPAEHLARLHARQESGLGDEIDGSADDSPCDEIDGVVVVEVHGRPPKPEGVDDEQRAETRERVGHEESLDGGRAGVQRRERAEHDGRRGESRGVQVDVEELVDRGKTGGRAGHAVVSRRQTVHVLIPRRSAREAELNANANDVHPSECASKGGSGSGRTEDEHQTRADERRAEVGDAVRQPSQHVEKGALVGGEDVAQVRAVEDVLKCRKHADPNGRAVLAGDELTGVEENQPSCYREERQEELASQRDEQAEQQQSGHESLDKRPRTLDDAEREDAENGEKDVLRVPGAPLVPLQAPQGVCGIEGSLELGDGGRR